MPDRSLYSIRNCRIPLALSPRCKRPQVFHKHKGTKGYDTCLLVQQEEKMNDEAKQTIGFLVFVIGLLVIVLFGMIDTSHDCDGLTQDACAAMHDYHGAD